MAIDVTTLAPAGPPPRLTDLSAIPGASAEVAAALQEAQSDGALALERNAAADMAARFLAGANSIVDEAFATAAVPGRDPTQGVTDRLDGIAADMLAAVSDPALRSALARSLDAVAARTIARTRRDGARRRAAFLREELAKRSALRLEAAVGLGLVDQVAAIEMEFADIDDMVAEGTLDEVEGTARKVAFLDGLRRRTIGALAASDPIAADQQLAAGAFDHLFANDDDKAETGRVLADAARRRRVAEGRAVLAQLESHAELLGTTGAGLPGLGRQALRSLDDDALRQFLRTERQALARFQGRRRLALARPEEMAAAITEIVAAADLDQQRAGELMADLGRDRDRELAERARDPVAAVMRRPDVAQRFLGPEFPSPDSVQARITAQSEIGIERPRPMSVPELSAFREQLAAAEPDQAGQLIAAVRATFGAGGAAQLAAFLLSVEGPLSRAVSVGRNRPDLARRILRGWARLRSDASVAPDPSLLDAATAAAFGAAFEFAPMSGQAHRQTAAAIAADLAKDRNGDPDDPALLEYAARLAVGAVPDASGRLVGGPFAFRGRVLLPPMTRPELNAADLSAILDRIAEEDPGLRLADSSGNPLPAPQILAGPVICLAPGLIGFVRPGGGMVRRMPVEDLDTAPPTRQPPVFVVDLETAQ